MKDPSGQRNRFAIEPIEPRILLSADIAGLLDPEDNDSLTDGHETQVIEHQLQPGEAVGPAEEADGLVDWDVGIEAQETPEEGDSAEANGQTELDDPILDAVLPEPEVLTLEGEDPLQVVAEEAPATPENGANSDLLEGQNDPADDQADELETPRTRGTLTPGLGDQNDGETPPVIDPDAGLNEGQHDPATEAEISPVGVGDGLDENNENTDGILP
ncbi:MAG: LEPR-XLL domain-containing protein, partial [Planctomycetota bacterium]